MQQAQWKDLLSKYCIVIWKQAGHVFFFFWCDIFEQHYLYDALVKHLNVRMQHLSMEEVHMLWYWISQSELIK